MNRNDDSLKIVEASPSKARSKGQSDTLKLNAQKHQSSLENKIFVNCTLNEILMHGCVYRIVKFYRIKDGQELRSFVLMSPRFRSTTNKLMNSVSEMLLAKRDSVDFNCFKSDGNDKRSSSNFMNKNLRHDTKELKKYHNWLEEHQEYANSRTYYLRNML